MSVERGDRIRVEYAGRFEDGTVFATSEPTVAVEHGLASADADSLYDRWDGAVEKSLDWAQNE